MYLRDDLYAILNKYNLTREAKEKVLDIMIKEKDDIYKAIKRDDSLVVVLETFTESDRVFEAGKAYECVDQDKHYIYLMHDSHLEFAFTYDFLRGKVKI